MYVKVRNWDKGDVHRAFLPFCVKFTYTLYFKTLL